MHNTIHSVLIVDDERPVAELVRAVLSPEYSCVLASTCAEAFTALQARSFDLALIDQGLPDISGLFLLPFIRATAPQTVAIIFSGKADEESVAEAHGMGAAEFIRKPVNLIHLREVVESAIAYKATNAA